MLTWLADAARSTGLRVEERPGWKTRGHGQMAGFRGVLCHHTGGGGRNDLAVVEKGRADLPGPLAQIGLDRDKVVIIAAGVCWHAGTGGPLMGVPKNNGNDWLVGIEMVSNGSGRDVTAWQREAYPRLVAGLLGHADLDERQVAFHRSWAPGRKSDPGGFDLDDFRGDVRGHLRGSGPAPRPNPSTPGTPGADDMTPEQDKMLRDVHAQLFGPWPSWADPARKHTLVDLARQCEAALTKSLEFSSHHGATTDNALGQTLSVRKEVVGIRGTIGELRQSLARIEAALPQQTDPAPPSGRRVV